MFKAEKNLAETLASEYRTQTLAFWNNFIEYLEGAAERLKGRNLHAGLNNRIEQGRRRRILSR